MRRINFHRGFSIVELMVVLAIAGILVTLAVPSFRDTIDRQKLSAASSDLFASVAMARNEAIRRGTRADLQAIGGDWNQGWEIRIPTGATTSDLIYTHGAIPNGITIAAASNIGAILSYTGTGRTRTAGNSQTVVTGNLTISVNTNGSPHRRLLRINAVGRPLLCNPAIDTTCV